MTGTVIVSNGKSFDVRTIDFEQIIGAFRLRAKDSQTAKMLLQTVDEFGMDMICADELNAAQFRDFYRLLTDIRADLVENEGVVGFIDQVCQAAQVDVRYGTSTTKHSV